MKIKIATVEDINGLYELNALFENETTVELMAKSLAENDHEIVCIAYVNNIAVGFCNAIIVSSMCYSDSRADIESLYVRDEFRRQGIGKALISCLENEFTARGIRHFHITTKNKAALTLYEKIGYVDSGEVLLEKTIQHA